MLPDLEDLKLRYIAACDLQQEIDKIKIADCILRWNKNIGGPKDPKVTFISTPEDAARAARAAWAESAASAARAARAAWAESAAWAASAASAAWAAWAESAARAAWAERAASAAWAESAAMIYDIPYTITLVIGATELKDKKTFDIWNPLFEAFEAGALMMFVGEKEIFIETIPVIDRSMGKLGDMDLEEIQQAQELYSKLVVNE